MALYYIKDLQKVMPRKLPQVEATPSTEADLQAASDDPDYVTLYHKTPTRNVSSILQAIRITALKTREWSVAKTPHPKVEIIQQTNS